MSDYEDFVDFADYARRFRDPGPRRYLRDYSDPFMKYSAQEFYSRYRFTPQAVKNTILPMILPELIRPTRRGLPFAPEIMILITLRYFATGSFQKLDGDVMDIRQQSVSRIIAVVSNLIALQMNRYVKFPSTVDDINEVKQQFFEVGQFPGVIGCIDCTHIKIKSPGGTSSEVYRNRKGWFSINVQAITGPNLQFFDLVARWPGSTHDSFIYNSSSVKQRLILGNLRGQGILLGDSGYAVSSVLLTPFLAPSSNGQQKYNKSHIKTRNSIERAFGVWKRRFPCLQIGMGIKKETTVAVISACAALHNIAIQLDDIMVPADDDTLILDNLANVPVPEPQNCPGFLARQNIVNRFFS